MLKLISVEKPKKYIIEFDMYVPIKIRLEHWDMSKEHVIYWRTGDFNKNLLEIGLGSETGILKSLTLTSVDKVKFSSCVESVYCETIEGTPSFDIKMFPINGIRDFVNQIYVCLGLTEILISINSNTCIKRIKQDRIEFWLDSNDNLIHIKIIGITFEEMSVLKLGLQV